jgi:rhomboid protease GluP
LRKLNACPRCRAFFEVDEKVCPSCGTSIVPRLVRESGGLFDRLAARGLTAVNLLVGANVFLFLTAAIVQGGLIMKGGFFSIGGLTGATLDKLGAATPQRVVEGGQWWRLVCPMFLHVNLIHIFFNMMVLRQAGPLVEGALGSAKFMALYLLAGLVGDAASLYWHAPYPAGVGASGAVFGVIGMAAVLGHRAGIRDLTYAMLRWIVIVLFMGILLPNIDNAGHLGGLAAGVVVAFSVSDARTTRLHVGAVRFWDVMGLCGGALVLAAFGMVAAGG